MPERLLDRVEIEVGGEIVTLPWPSIDWIDGELVGNKERRPIMDEFEKADGSSRPASFTKEQKTTLLAVIDNAAEVTRVTEGEQLLAVIDAAEVTRVTEGEQLRDIAALSQWIGIPELWAALRKELDGEKSP